ncbi:MAG: sulfotransferase [Deltaproteobacteria bacterium]|nr:MAG: sulfotransferase [Deltaproteobacteria bacterium]
MAWRPPERPEWVRAINAGEVTPLCEEAELPLEREALLGEARARLGVADGGVADFCGEEFDADGLVEPLDRVLRALESEAELTLIGRWMTRRYLLRLLEVRLQLMAYLRADPGVRDEPIERPLFVAGAPRTGTTILYELLADDPALRAPLGWELLRPVPSPDPDPARRAADPRIALVDRELVLPQTVVSGLLAMHVYGGSKPKECVSAMSFTFLSEEFTARYHVPSYESWLERCDMTPAYRMHRLVLQILQRRSGAAAWLLKSPVHLRSLTTLFEVYPDAQVAITHRDPLTVLASLTSLIATLRWAHSDAVDFESIGAAHARKYRRIFDDLVGRCERKQLPEAQLHHSRYADFQRDPIAVVRDLFHRFGRPLDEMRLASVLASRARSEHGPHEYSFADLGLDAEAERSQLHRYQSFFAVPPERGRS